MPSDTKRPTIAIVELDYHADLLEQLLHLVDTSSFKVFCIISPQVYQQFLQQQYPQINFFITSQSEKIKHFFKNQKVDLIVLNTCASHFSMWNNVLKHHKSVLRVHNIHTYFDPFKHIRLPGNLLTIRKFLSHVILQQIFQLYHIRLQQMLKKVTFFSFLSNPMRAYAESNYPQYTSRIAPVLPIAFQSKNMLEHNLHLFKTVKNIRILVPGTLEPKRKDFRAIKDLVTCLNTQTERVIEIIFAGKTPAYALKFIESLKQYETNFLKIHYSTRYIPAETFHQLCSDAHIFFFPLARSTSFKIFTEQYGFSKISGSEKDLITYGKPCLIPSWYPLDPSLETLAFRFEPNSLKSLQDKMHQCMNLIVNDQHALTTMLNRHFQFYNYETMRQSLNDVLQNLIHA